MVTLTNTSQLTSAQLARADISTRSTDACNCTAFEAGTLSINITGDAAIRSEIRREGLELSEFFSIFAINYCEGSFVPDFESEDASPALTKCARPNLGHKFDMRRQVDKSIESFSDRLNVTLESDLNWPGDISSAFEYLISATAARVTFMLAGVMFLLLAVVLGEVAIFVDKRIVNVLLVAFSILALAALGIAAAIATTVITNVVGAINTDGEDVGLSAEQGDQFLAATWAGVALLFVSTVVASLQLCTAGAAAASSASERRQKKKEQKKRESEVQALLGMQTPSLASTMSLPMAMQMPQQMPMQMPPMQMPMQMPMRPPMPYQQMPMMGSQYGMGLYGEPYAPQGWGMGGRMGW
jgi:hypothetical protein